MAKSKVVELLLVENVENQGIVGDVVKVRIGYARNFLLPRGLATVPSKELIDQLAEKRKQAQAEVARLRSAREEMVAKLAPVELEVVRSCNQQGLLYGSVTQQDVAELLVAKGFEVRPRDVRLGQTIKRLGEYEVTIKPEQDLEVEIKIKIIPDDPTMFEQDENEPEAVFGDTEDQQGERTPNAPDEANALEA